MIYIMEINTENHAKFFSNNNYTIIDNILDKYLVIDSDTFFLNHTHFIKNDKCLYNLV